MSNDHGTFRRRFPLAIELMALTAVLSALAVLAVIRSEKPHPLRQANAQRTSPPTAPSQLPTPPPGSRKGLMAFQGGHFGGGGIFVTDVDTGAATRLTYGLGDTTPTWSPDGLHIAFAAMRRQELGCCADIYVIKADGTAETRLTNTPEAEISPAWSPSGERIAYNAYGPPGGQGSQDDTPDIMVDHDPRYELGRHGPDALDG